MSYDKRDWFILAGYFGGSVQTEVIGVILLLQVVIALSLNDILCLALFKHPYISIFHIE